MADLSMTNHQHFSFLLFPSLSSLSLSLSFSLCLSLALSISLSISLYIFLSLYLSLSLSLSISLFLSLSLPLYLSFLPRTHSHSSRKSHRAIRIDTNWNHLNPDVIHESHFEQRIIHMNVIKRTL